MPLVFFSLTCLTHHKCVASIFITYGINKFLDKKSFAVTIGDYHILPKALNKPIAQILPPFEIALGVLLIFDIAVLPTAAIITVLLLLFTVAIVRAGADSTTELKSCGCTANSTTPLWVALVRNAILLVALCLIILGELARLENLRLLPEYTILTLGSMAIFVVVTGRVMAQRNLSLQQNLQKLGEKRETDEQSMSTTDNNLIISGKDQGISSSFITRRSFAKLGTSVGFILLAVFLTGQVPTARAATYPCPTGTNCGCSSGASEFYGACIDIGMGRREKAVYNVYCAWCCDPYSSQICIESIDYSYSVPC